MLSLNSKHVQHVKNYLACNFKVNKVLPILQLLPFFHQILKMLILRRRFLKISSPLFSIFSLVGSRDHRTQFWKGATQGPFHQSFVAIGPVVSEEKIKM
jgi:hypothetical protein